MNKQRLLFKNNHYRLTLNKLLIIIITSMMILIAIGNSNRTSAQETDVQLEKKLANIAESAINSHLSVLVDIKDGGLDAADINELAPYYQEAYAEKIAQVQKRKADLLKVGIEYTTFNSTLSVTKLQYENDKVKLFATNKVMLTLKDSDIEIGYVDEHTFTFSKVNEFWFLEEDRVKEPMDYVLDNDLPKTFSPVAVFLPVVASNKSIEQRGFNQMVSSSSHKMAAINHKAVVDYAVQFWNNYNSNYRSFGNDCTNFVSQAMRAGGWLDTSRYTGSKWSTGSWWYQSDDQTRTWTWSPDFYTFAINSGRGTNVPNFGDLSTGDVIQIDWTGDGQIDHAMIVTAIDLNGNYFVTYHSNNRLNYPVNDLIIQYRNAVWYRLDIN